MKFVIAVVCLALLSVVAAAPAVNEDIVNLSTKRAQVLAQLESALSELHSERADSMSHIAERSRARALDEVIGRRAHMDFARPGLRSDADDQYLSKSQVLRQFVQSMAAQAQAQAQAQAHKARSPLQLHDIFHTAARGRSLNDFNLASVLAAAFSDHDRDLGNDSGDEDIMENKEDGRVDGADAEYIDEAALVATPEEVVHVKDVEDEQEKTDVVASDHAKSEGREVDAAVAEVHANSKQAAAELSASELLSEQDHIADKVNGKTQDQALNHKQVFVNSLAEALLGRMHAVQSQKSSLHKAIATAAAAASTIHSDKSNLERATSEHKTVAASAKVNKQEAAVAAVNKQLKSIAQEQEQAHAATTQEIFMSAFTNALRSRIQGTQAQSNVASRANQLAAAMHFAHPSAVQASSPRQAFVNTLTRALLSRIHATQAHNQGMAVNAVADKATIQDKAKALHKVADSDRTTSVHEKVKTEEQAENNKAAELMDVDAMEDMVSENVAAPAPSAEGVKIVDSEHKQAAKMADDFLADLTW